MGQWTSVSPQKCSLVFYVLRPAFPSQLAMLFTFQHHKNNISERFSRRYNATGKMSEIFSPRYNATGKTSVNVSLHVTTPQEECQWTFLSTLQGHRKTVNERFFPCYNGARKTSLNVSLHVIVPLDKRSWTFLSTLQRYKTKHQWTFLCISFSS